MVHFQGKRLFYFHFSSHLIRGCPVRANLILKGSIVKENKREVTKVVSFFFVKTIENMEVYSYMPYKRQRENIENCKHRRSILGTTHSSL